MNTIVAKEKHSRSVWLCGLVLLPLALLLAPPSFAQDFVWTLTLTRAPITGPSPVTESFIVTPPPPIPGKAAGAPPFGIVVLLPGGDGDIQLTPEGPIPPAPPPPPPLPTPPATQDGTLDINSNNFLTRSRWLFGGHGFLVITLDAASDYLLTAPVILTGHQGDAQHISDVEAVIAWARSIYPGVYMPVWLVGTSRGTAGAFVAATAPPPVGPDGLVFSSAINDNVPPLDPDSLFSAALSSITVPVLILNDWGNTCPNTLPSGDPAVKAALTSSPVVNIINIPPSGLLPLTDSCHGLSPHGYFGDEPLAVLAISAWILIH